MEVYIITWIFHRRLPEPWNQAIISLSNEHFQWPPKHVNNKGMSVFALTSTDIYTFWMKTFKSIWKYVCLESMCKYWRDIINTMQNYRLHPIIDDVLHRQVRSFWPEISIWSILCYNRWAIMPWFQGSGRTYVIYFPCPIKQRFNHSVQM